MTIEQSQAVAEREQLVLSFLTRIAIGQAAQDRIDTCAAIEAAQDYADEFIAWRELEREERKRLICRKSTES